MIPPADDTDPLTPLLIALGFSDAKSHQQARQAIVEQGLSHWMREHYQAHVRMLLNYSEAELD